MPHPLRRSPRILPLLLLTLVGLLAGPTTAARAEAEAPAGATVTSSAIDAVAHPKPGQSGSEVRALQNKLIAVGYLKAELNSGYYGRYTKAAVKRVVASSCG